MGSHVTGKVSQRESPGLSFLLGSSLTEPTTLEEMGSAGGPGNMN